MQLAGVGGYQQICTSAAERQIAKSRSTKQRQRSKLTHSCSCERGSSSEDLSAHTHFGTGMGIHVYHCTTTSKTVQVTNQLTVQLYNCITQSLGNRTVRLAEVHLHAGTWKVDVRLPGNGNSNSHGARPVHLIITLFEWIRTSRLSIKNSLSAAGNPPL